MKKTNLLLIWALLIVTGGYAQSLEFHQVDPLYKVFKERTWYPEWRDTLRAAAGETVSAHFSPVMLEYLNKGKKVEIYSPLYWELLKVHADMVLYLRGTARQLCQSFY